MLFVCTLKIQKWLTINKPKTIIFFKQLWMPWGVGVFPHY